MTLEQIIYFFSPLEEPLQGKKNSNVIETVMQKYYITGIKTQEL